jgi:hypothetical protein
MDKEVVKWELKRSQLNHDWMQNIYLNSLSAFVARLSKPSNDNTRVIRFVSTQFIEWSGKTEEFRSLVNSFEREMSPATLLDLKPLRNLPPQSREWMKEVVHLLWTSRYPVKTWINKATLALNEADLSYEEIRARLAPAKPSQPASARELLPEFVRFVDAVTKVSRCISSFPNRVLVV